MLPLSLMTTLTAVAIASFRPFPSAWGFNHFAYFPTSVGVALWALVVISMLPGIRHRLAGGITRVLERSTGRRRRVTTIQLGFAVGFAILCVVFRSATYLWGDTELMATIAEQAVAVEESIIGSVRVAIGKTPRAPGAAAVHAVVGQLGTAVGLTARNTIAIWHALLGGLYVFVTMRIIAQLELHATSRLWIAILLYSSGAMVLFFGYTEVYTLPYLFATVIALSSHKYLDGNSSLTFLVVMTVIAVTLNVQASLMLPPLCFLLLRRRRTDERMNRRVVAIVVVVTIAAGISLQFVPGLSGYYRPLFGGGGTLTGQYYPFDTPLKSQTNWPC